MSFGHSIQGKKWMMDAASVLRRCTSEDAMANFEYYYTKWTLVQLASVEIDKWNYDYILIIHSSLDQRLAKNFCIEIHLASTGRTQHIVWLCIV